MKPKPPSPRKSSPSPSDKNIKQTIINYIESLKKLSDYGIRDLVNHASKFGPELKQQKLETNQIRKFLDAINRVKALLIEEASVKDGSQKLPSHIEDKVVLLKPKLAYAAARQSAALPLSEVMTAAIDKTIDLDDFNRLVQLIESIIAYHKEEEGKKNGNRYR